MSKLTLEYKEVHHILEVDKKEYEIPKRTVKIAKALKEHDEKLSRMDEYQSNMEVLYILFGEEKAKEMFPDGEDTNLDKLLKCVKLALAAFYAEFNEASGVKNVLDTEDKKQKKR